MKTEELLAIPSCFASPIDYINHLNRMYVETLNPLFHWATAAIAYEYHDMDAEFLPTTALLYFGRRADEVIDATIKGRELETALGLNNQTAIVAQFIQLRDRTSPQAIRWFGECLLRYAAEFDVDRDKTKTATYEYLARRVNLSASEIKKKYRQACNEGDLARIIHERDEIGPPYGFEEKGFGCFIVGDDDPYELGTMYTDLFGQLERAIVRAGFSKSSKPGAQADWNKFARHLGSEFYDRVKGTNVAPTLIGEPLRKMNLKRLEWQPEYPKPLRNVVELFEMGLCRVRNGFFHENRYVSGPNTQQWERDAGLLRECIGVLNMALETGSEFSELPDIKMKKLRQTHG